MRRPSGSTSGVAYAQYDMMGAKARVSKYSMCKKKHARWHAFLNMDIFYIKS